MMVWKIFALVVWLTMACGTAAYAKSDRWHKLTEDEDLVYYIDDNSIVNTRAGTTLFWMKQVPRKGDFLKKEYKLEDLDYILFNYELNCDKAVYKSRGIFYYDRNGKQIDKQVPTYLGMSDAEPVPPESIMEVAQRYVCAADEQSLPERSVPIPETAPARPAPPSEPGETPELQSDQPPGQ